MKPEPLTVDWSSIPVQSTEELLRQGETCLEALLTVGIAADSRATTLCGILGGAALALLAAAATIVAASEPDKRLIIAAVATAGPLLVASFLAGRAGRPSDFHVNGYEPRRLVKSATSAKWMKRYAIIDVQTRIDDNRASLDRSAKLISWSFAVALSAIPIGLAVFIGSQYL